MFRRLIICLAASFCSWPAFAQTCPASQLNDARNAIRNASGCQAGLALYESCGAKATSYVNLGVLAEEARARCEKIFLSELHGRTRGIYKSRQMSCYKRYLDNNTPVLYTPKSICGPYLAEDYARRFLKAKEDFAKNPNPPL